ncbi:uncharacterized protein B0T15DRAFT_321335 [Chaetomium strumarium]|uniref:Uncharacterized protein n=1 Tax=Chaetomium strumarium TaxID=1170767 RepID=A0AAJ0GKR0_9PEZI|nr:hypothetical protein B0T15DRAFT_321335 [Chaetomium strumarium]
MPPSTPQGQYPGVALPLRYLRQEGEAGIDFYPLGSTPGLEGTASEPLQVREVAMMILMDRLTDKPNWHEKVFDDAIVAKWREEAVSQNEEGVYQEILGHKSMQYIPMPKRTRFMTKDAFDYCIAELRAKAAYFKETGLVFTLNRGERTAIKSDTLVSNELRQGLKAAFKRLRADQAAEPDWHPWTDDKVQDLVHPSLYPFVYGKTRFIPEEVVGVTDAVDKWSGKGSVVPMFEERGPSEHDSDSYGRDYLASYWSTKYQWLPANLAFQEDGTVRFTSYINNLHPNKYPEIYRLVEKLVDKAVPAWDRVLSGRAVTERGELQNRMCELKIAVDEEDDELWEQFDPAVLAAHEATAGPVRYDEYNVEWGLEHSGNREKNMDETERQAEKARLIAYFKWKEIRDPILPRTRDYEPVTYQVRQTLGGRFKNSGLQVIVKMASIELTPEKPNFPVGGWHIEGQMNEHIVATALYYLDSENVTPSHLSFRMITDVDDLEDFQMSIGQDMYHVYERIWGTELGVGGSDSEALQIYGSVETREGRLLAFPNVFQHRVSPFSLQDRTKPGHRRFIALWLVDPHTRITSTANVPPQQFDWWAEAVFGTESKATAGEMPPELFQLLLEKGADRVVKPTEELVSKVSSSNRLPVELMQMIRRENVVPDGLMTADEARAHRLALMEERSAFSRNAEHEWTTTAYSFCEH